MPGFLPFSDRSFFMMDFVCVAMLLVLPAIAFGIYMVRFKKSYDFHKKWQLAIAIILLVAVVCFELEVRFSNWQEAAKLSPFYQTWLYPALVIHLIFAISTVFLWIACIYGAIKKFTKPPRPSIYSPKHKLLGRLSVAGMFGTAVTGWIFYYVAFVA
ncbi:MAG: DUF420 domain-containing protein [Oligoflexales bacterium]|nr:DUF420 domain-containing protein [Oligoflexales bacterium]